MAIQKTYTEARAHLSDLCNQVVQDRDIVFITRRGVPEVAMIAADELVGLMETAHLLRSPENARRLLTALNRALSREGAPEDVSSLRVELGLEAPA